MTEVCPSLPKTKGQKPFMVVTKNSVKSNTTTATSVLKSSPTKTKNVLRRKATNQKNNNQTSSTGSEILMNDQPKSPIKKKNTTTTINKTNKKVISDNTEIRDIPRVQKLEQEFDEMQNLISNLDTSMNTLVATLEEMKPAYIHAMKLMSATAQPISDQKNNLVFYGLPKEPLEIQMEKEPEFCRDILETRIKMIFREHLKISRDIPFITVYRFTTANPDPEEVSPIIATFRSNRDKENILRHASSSKLLRQKGVFVTEDFSNKRVQGRRKTGRKLAQSDTLLKSTEADIRKNLSSKNSEDGGASSPERKSSGESGISSASTTGSTTGSLDQSSSCTSDYNPLIQCPGLFDQILL